MTESNQRRLNGYSAAVIAAVQKRAAQSFTAHGRLAIRKNSSFQEFLVWTCAIQCEFARLNFSTSASSSRRRGIFDSRAKYTFMRARLPRPSDPQSQLGKMPALCGNLFEMSVEGTRHEAYFK